MLHNLPLFPITTFQSSPARPNAKKALKRRRWTLDHEEPGLTQRPGTWKTIRINYRKRAAERWRTMNTASSNTPQALQLMCSSVQYARPNMYIFPLKPAKRVHDSVSQTDRKTWEAKFSSPYRFCGSAHTNFKLSTC